MADALLFLDTETTGFPKGGALIQEGQARVCQIAWLMTDRNGGTLSEFSTLIRPGNWEIGEGAFKVHGISTERCVQYGMDQDDVMGLLSLFQDISVKYIAHNEKFDREMLDIEIAHSAMEAHGKQNPQEWFCTMMNNIHISETGRWPKLDFCLQYYCGRTLGDSAHDAMVDTRACRDIYFGMVAQGVIPND